MFTKKIGRSFCTQNWASARHRERVVHVLDHPRIPCANMQHFKVFSVENMTRTCVAAEPSCRRRLCRVSMCSSSNRPGATGMQVCIPFFLMPPCFSGLREFFFFHARELGTDKYQLCSNAYYVSKTQDFQDLVLPSLIHVGQHLPDHWVQGVVFILCGNAARKRTCLHIYIHTNVLLYV